LLQPDSVTAILTQFKDTELHNYFLYVWPRLARFPNGHFDDC